MRGHLVRAAAPDVSRFSMDSGGLVRQSGRVVTAAAGGDGADDDEALLELMTNAWSNRQDRYSEQRSSLQAQEQPIKKIEMYYIGG